MGTHCCYINRQRHKTGYVVLSGIKIKPVYFILSGNPKDITLSGSFPYRRTCYLLYGGHFSLFLTLE
jgi:hypothetical protein